MRMDTITGIDLVGERKPVIHRPGSKLVWSYHYSLDELWV
jgi:hypothetical protein